MSIVPPKVSVEEQEAGQSRRVVLQMECGCYLLEALLPAVWRSLARVTGHSIRELSDVRGRPVARVDRQHVAVALLDPALAEPVADLLTQIGGAAMDHVGPDRIENLPAEDESGGIHWLNGKPEHAHEVAEELRRQGQRQWRSDIDTGGWDER